MVASFAFPLFTEPTSAFDAQREHVKVPKPIRERRAQPRRRLGVRAEVNLRVCVGLGFCISHCTAVELSTTGIVLRDCYPLQIGKPVVVYLTRKSGESLRLQARAVRATQRGQALEFRALSDEEQLSIAELIDQQGAASTETLEEQPFALVRRRLQRG